MPHDDPPAYEPDFIKLVQTALAKKRAGQKLKRDELRAIERYQRDEDERARRRHYAAIPKKWWVAWSGRQHKVLADQATIHGLPVSGETIDLAAVVKWLHDFLADNTHKLRKPDASEDDGTEAGERLRNLRLKNEHLELELDAAKRNLLNREHVHDCLLGFAVNIRAAGEHLERRFGPDALTILNDAIDNAERHVEQLFTPTQSPPSDSPPNDDPDRQPAA